MTKAGTDSPAGRRRPLARALVWVAILIALSALGVVGWNEVLKDRFIPKRWGVVEDGLLYRSGQLSPRLVRRMLAEHGIKAVVDLCAEEPGNPAQSAEEAACRELGIEHRRYPLSGDGTGDLRQYADALATVIKAKREGKPVLVHCAAGTQRTGGAIYFYRVLVQKRPADAAYQEMLGFGVRPEKDKPLLDYIEQNTSKLALLLKDSLVPAVPPAPGERGPQ